jgi:hypothetical protein
MPPGRIWPGAAFAPPRAFVVPGSPPPRIRDLPSDSGKGVPGRLIPRFWHETCACGAVATIR